MTQVVMEGNSSFLKANMETITKMLLLPFQSVLQDLSKGKIKKYI